MNWTRNPLAYGAVASMLIVLLKVLINDASVTIGSKVINAGHIDSGLATAALGAILAPYVASRHNSFRDHNAADDHDEGPPKPKG